MHTRNAIPLLFGLGLGVAGVGCSATDASHDTSPAIAAGTGGAAGSPTSDAGSSGGSGGVIAIDGGDGGFCSPRCSTDLRASIDCHGDTHACKDDESCDVPTGVCTDACQVAINTKQSVGCDYYATYMDL